MCRYWLIHFAWRLSYFSPCYSASPEDKKIRETLLLIHLNLKQICGSGSHRPPKQRTNDTPVSVGLTLIEIYNIVLGLQRVKMIWVIPCQTSQFAGSLCVDQPRFAWFCNFLHFNRKKAWIFAIPRGISEIWGMRQIGDVVLTGSWSLHMDWLIYIHSHSW